MSNIPKGWIRVLINDRFPSRRNIQISNINWVTQNGRIVMKGDESQFIDTLYRDNEILSLIAQAQQDEEPEFEAGSEISVIDKLPADFTINAEKIAIQSKLKILDKIIVWLTPKEPNYNKGDVYCDGWRDSYFLIVEKLRELYKGLEAENADN